ncbi:heparan-sulfate 6-O-sulfotransferase 2-like [Urocitellus parryii]
MAGKAGPLPCLAHQPGMQKTDMGPVGAQMLEQPCERRVGQKKYTCHRPDKRETWLFSRFSTGWSCGLHADWTELTSCVPAVVDSKRDARMRPSRNFHYITILRDPVFRYLSEWRHVQRGATWKASLHVCDGRPPTSEELPSCYTGDDWSGCPLKEFMDYPYNLANNHQVCMLSDLTLVGCYNLSVMPEKQRNKVLLERAKSNLKHMAFFGLTEFQRTTQYLFEKTFNMNFISPFTQYNTTRASSVEINEEIQKCIEGLNFLDMELYSYAKDLFLQRYQFMRQKEHQEQAEASGATDISEGKVPSDSFPEPESGPEPEPEPEPESESESKSKCKPESASESDSESDSEFESEFEPEGELGKPQAEPRPGAARKQHQQWHPYYIGSVEKWR